MKKKGAEAFMNTLYRRDDFINEKYDIIFLVGQSNAEGHGFGEVENPFEPSDAIMQLVDSYPVMYKLNAAGVDELDVPDETIYRIKPAQENTRKIVGRLGCFALPFARLYSEQFLAGSDRKALVIRAAIGGTGFMRNQWTPDGVLFKRACEMLDIALSLNPENRLAAILWHQGENEAVDGKGKGYDYLYSFYEKALTTLISDFNEKYGNAPFIAAGHCEDWVPRFAVESPAITDATKTVVAKFDNAGYVETAGLGSNDRIQKGKYLDDAHFNRPALYELGERYFKAYKEIIAR